MARKQLNIRPADGFKVNDLEGKPIPEKGTSVPDTVYWRRRLRTGVIVDIDAEKRAAAEARAAEKRDDAKEPAKTDD